MRRELAAPLGFWAKVAQHETGLPEGEAFLMLSIDNWKTSTYGGSFVEVNRQTAAKLLANGTHKLATEDEQAQYYIKRNEKIRTRQLDDLKSKAAAVVYLPSPVPGNDLVTQTHPFPGQQPAAPQTATPTAAQTRGRKAETAKAEPVEKTEE